MLGKFAHEVMQELTVDDVNRWIAYDRIKTDKQEKKRKRKKR